MGGEGTARVRCLAEEQSTMIPAGLEPGPFHLETSALVNPKATAAPIQIRSSTKLVSFHTKIELFVKAKREP